MKKDPNLVAYMNDYQGFIKSAEKFINAKDDKGALIPENQKWEKELENIKARGSVSPSDFDISSAMTKWQKGQPKAAGTPEASKGTEAEAVALEKVDLNALTPEQLTARRQVIEIAAWKREEVPSYLGFLDVGSGPEDWAKARRLDQHTQAERKAYEQQLSTLREKQAEAIKNEEFKKRMGY